MSRHRDIRNLTDDDYYDDYYDDDYYDEDEEEIFQEQERKRKKAIDAKKEKTTNILITPTKIVSSKNVKINKVNRNNLNNTFDSMKVGSSSAKPDIAKSSAIAGITKPPDGFKRPTTDSTVISSVTPTAGVHRTKQTESSPIKQQKDFNLKEKKINLQDAKISKTPKKNSKKKLSLEILETLKSKKSRLSMVVLGHVDAGKSTLMGQVLIKTGVVQERVVIKYKKKAAQIGKASFALAWIMDEDESERERGVTIDIATKYITTNMHDLAILDAPGHADYVPAMITGAASADVGLLVVAATPNEFESGFGTSEGCFNKSGVGETGVGQTKEHIILSRGLGVSQLIVAINKLDVTDPAWSQDRFNEIQKILEPFLKSSGFNMRRVRFIPVSGLTGENVNDLYVQNNTCLTGLRSWYKGPTLLEGIDLFEPVKRNLDKPLRLVVSDVFAEGKGITVKGRVVQGYVSTGDRVVVNPVGDEALVNRVEHGGLNAIGSIGSKNNNNSRQQNAVAGDSVDLTLFGIDIARVHPGNILSDIELELRPPIRKIFRAKIFLMEQLKVPVIQGSQVLLHMHSLDIPAIIYKLVSVTSRIDGSLNERPRILTSGVNAIVEIKVNKRMCVESFEACRALGRIVLRKGGDTIALGRIET